MTFFGAVPVGRNIGSLTVIAGLLGLGDVRSFALGTEQHSCQHVEPVRFSPPQILILGQPALYFGEYLIVNDWQCVELDPLIVIPLQESSAGALVFVVVAPSYIDWIPKDSSN